MGSKRFAEFFAGVGLVRLGLERAGWECVFANDNDPKKTAIYGMNFTSRHLDVRSVSNLKPSDIPGVDLATASFPCTDLSLAGKRRGLKGKESGSFYSFIKLIENMKSKRPGLLLIENVPGLLSSHGGRDIATILGALNGLGYRADMFIVDASWFAPQSRRRLFILGVKTKSKSSDIDNFINRDERLKPKAVSSVVASLPNIGWKFAKIPDPPAESKLRLKNIVETDPEGGWWDKAMVSALLSQMNKKHRHKINDMAAARGGKQNSSAVYRTAYRRVRDGVVRAEVRSDAISGCLRTPSGGSSRQILVCAEGGHVKARHLTARECARLQGAPESFRLPARQSDGLLAFGDAVCVPVMRWIGLEILNKIAGEMDY